MNFNCRVCDSPFSKIVALNSSQIVDPILLKNDCVDNLRVANCVLYKNIFTDDAGLRTTIQTCTQCVRTHFLKASVNAINQCTPRRNFDPKC